MTGRGLQELVKRNGWQIMYERGGEYHRWSAQLWVGKWSPLCTPHTYMRESSALAGLARMIGKVREAK